MPRISTVPFSPAPGALTLSGPSKLAVAALPLIAEIGVAFAGALDVTTGCTRGHVKSKWPVVADRLA